MRRTADEHTLQKKNRKPRGISERLLFFIIGLLLLFGIALTMYYYHAGQKGTLSPTPTPAPPDTTPILDENGDPAPIRAWFPALAGESFFAESADGKTLLVDAGTEEDTKTLLAFLRERKTETIDAVFLSSAEEHHIGGMTDIVQEIPVGCLYLTPECAADDRCTSLLALLEEKNVPVQQIHASFVSTVDWADGAELRILSPHDVTYTSKADESLMLRLAYGNSEILLAGNAGALAERMAVKALPNELLHADILKLANGGDKHAASDAFLGAVKPDLAIVCGMDLLPSTQDMLARLTQKGLPIIGTQENGTIEIILDGLHAEVVK